MVLSLIARLMLFFVFSRIFRPQDIALMSAFALHEVDPIMEGLVQRLLIERPTDVASFAINQLNDFKVHFTPYALKCNHVHFNKSHRLKPTRSLIPLFVRDCGRRASTCVFWRVIFVYLWLLWVYPDNVVSDLSLPCLALPCLACFMPVGVCACVCVRLRIYTTCVCARACVGEARGRCQETGADLSF